MQIYWLRMTRRIAEEKEAAAALLQRPIFAISLCETLTEVLSFRVVDPVQQELFLKMEPVV